MNKLLKWFKSESFIHKIYPEMKRACVVILFTTIYGIGVSWFLEASVVPLYTGGIPGFGQLIRDAIYAIFNINLGKNFLGIFIIFANIPVLILGWFGVSHKFTIYSFISVIIQASILGWIPIIDMGLGEIEHAFTAAVLGGLIIGLGAGGALRYGTSTGGLDIVAQYLAFKKGKSVGFFSMAMNLLIAVLGGLIVGGKTNLNGQIVAGGLIMSYTVIRLIVTTLITDRMHTAYQFVAVDIITTSPQILVDEILFRLYRGVTLTKVEGAYSHHKKTLIYVVISSYELHTLKRIVTHIDPTAFIVVKPVKNVIGNFKRKTIA